MCAFSPGIPRYPSIRVEPLARAFLILTALKPAWLRRLPNPLCKHKPIRWRDLARRRCGELLRLDGLVARLHMGGTPLRRRDDHLPGLV